MDISISFNTADNFDYMYGKLIEIGFDGIDFDLGGDDILTDEYAGLCLMYAAIHGEEDKKFMPNPADEEQFLADFNKMFNEK